MDVDERVASVLQEYKDLFGHGELVLSDDIAIAQAELQALQAKQQSLKDCEERKRRQLLPSEVRLAEYEHLRKSKSSSVTEFGLPGDVATEEDTNGIRKKSALELMAEERDMKRRRQTYKGGKTHTGKKSYTEVMREVIDKQMDMLKTIMPPQCETTEKQYQDPKS